MQKESKGDINALKNHWIYSKKENIQDPLSFNYIQEFAIKSCLTDRKCKNRQC